METRHNKFIRKFANYLFCELDLQESEIFSLFMSIHQNKEECYNNI